MSESSSVKFKDHSTNSVIGPISAVATGPSVRLPALAGNCPWPAPSLTPPPTDGLAFALLGWFFLLPLLIWGIVDPYRTAKRINAANGDPQWAWVE
ncbi:MAG: hypothetical protein ACE10C_08790 [Candidatus Binatia bacterium]